MIRSAFRMLVALGVLWHAVRPGVWQAELAMAEDGPLAMVRAVAFRLDPSRLRFELGRATRDHGLRGAWTIDSIPASAVVAFNAGQFSGGFPWGWLVEEGREVQAPGTGTLAMSFVVDSLGRVSFNMPADLSHARGRALLAFQSYPALLVGDGEVPWELLAPDRGVNLRHRDSRVSLCLLVDGTIVVAITRFRGLGDAGEALPWGPTVPEMADFMRSLGCRRAMLLDGGISSQLAVRRADGTLMRWKNWRAVPLALVAFPRDR